LPLRHEFKGWMLAKMEFIYQEFLICETVYNLFTHVIIFDSIKGKFKMGKNNWMKFVM
jgi:hypothetical protein